MEGREKVLRQALHNVNKASLQHGCLCTPLGRNFRDKQNLQRYFKRARLLLLSWNEFDLDSSCWLAVNWDFTQSDVSSNDHDWLWLLTNNLRLNHEHHAGTASLCWAIVKAYMSMCICYMILLSECYSFIYSALWPLCIFYILLFFCTEHLF